MKILCIGNSFSQDATKYLQKISDGRLFVRNLYIGGCSLERHYNNILGDVYDYEYQENAEAIRKESINHALTLENWDYITVQQVSQDSGIPSTYEPYISYIINFIKEKCPNAKIVLHRTWAYDDLSDHGGFANYGNDRKNMFECIVKTTEQIAEKYGLPIIKVGNAVEKARELDEFKPITGKLNINRDGFHLSLDYGRYLAGLVFYKFFTGDDLSNVTYVPNDTEKEITDKLKNIANNI
jgi:hypothetical protein